LAGILVILILFAAIGSYFEAFSAMASYDDEGTLIAWIRGFAGGQPLYDVVRTAYGPLYYAYQWLAHVPLGIPVTNDSVRFVTAFFRVIAVLLVFLLSRKLTSSNLISWGAAIAAYGELNFLAPEPAHPQELCIVLVIALPLAAFLEGRRFQRMFWLGALAGAMTLTKVNLGIFAIAAIGVTLVFCAKPAPLASAARVAAGAAALVLPAALMSALLGQPWVQRFCALETLSLAAALLASLPVRSDVKVEWRDFAVAAFGFGAAVLLISAFALVSGSSVHAMIEVMILSPRRVFGSLWWVPVRLSALMIPWAAGCVVLAAFAGAGRLNADLAALLKLGFVAVLVKYYPIDRPAAIMSFTAPLLWLPLVPPPPGARDSKGSFARLLLLFVSLFQLLYAYPVAGSQLPFTQICTLVVAAVCLADVLRYAEGRLPGAPSELLRRSLPIAAAAALAAVCVFKTVKTVRIYESRPSLEMAGATMIRLNASDTRAHNEMVRFAKARSCRTLITVPGMPSFHEWIGLPAIPEFLGGPWLLMLDHAKQEAMAQRLASDREACVIVDREQEEIWKDRARYASPMADFIRDRFHPAFESGAYTLLVR
jgi:hypothetical protein